MLFVASCGKEGFDSLPNLDGAGDGGVEADADLGLSRPADYPGCPAMRPSADGADALIAWAAFPPGNGSADIRFARLDQTGAVILGPVNAGIAGGAAQVFAVIERGSEYAVFFLDQDRLTMARLDANGSVVDTTVVRAGVVDASAQPTDTGYLVAWASDGTSPTGTVVARLDASGVLDVPSINQIEAQAVGADTAVAANGNFYVAYGGLDDVGIAEVDADGVLVDGPVLLGAGERGRDIDITRGQDKLLVLHRGNSTPTTMSYSFMSLAPLAPPATIASLSPKNLGAWAYGSGAFVPGTGFAIAHHTDSLALGDRLALSIAPETTLVAGSSTIISDDDEQASCTALTALGSGILAAWRTARADTGVIIARDVQLP
jgi:hypothetical protein